MKSEGFCKVRYVIISLLTLVGKLQPCFPTTKIAILSDMADSLTNCFTNQYLQLCLDFQKMASQLPTFLTPGIKEKTENTR